MSEHINLARAGEKSGLFTAGSAVWVDNESGAHVRLIVGRQTKRDGIDRLQVHDGKLETDVLIDPEGLVFFMFQNIDRIRDARLEFGLVGAEGQPDEIEPEELFEVDPSEVLRNLNRPYAT